MLARLPVNINGVATAPLPVTVEFAVGGIPRTDQHEGEVGLRFGQHTGIGGGPRVAGGRVHRVELLPEHSTTALIQKAEGDRPAAAQ